MKINSNSWLRTKQKEAKQRSFKYNRYMRIDVYINQTKDLLITHVSFYTVSQIGQVYSHFYTFIYIPFPLVSIFLILVWIGDTLLHHCLLCEIFPWSLWWGKLLSPMSQILFTLLNTLYYSQPCLPFSTSLWAI